MQWKIKSLLLHFLLSCFTLKRIFSSISKYTAKKPAPRTGFYKKREKYEIGISAVRGGNIVGEHEVIFAGLDEVIEFRHTAYSKGVFAKGAVQAAKYMAGKPAGFYDMGDVVCG